MTISRALQADFFNVLVALGLWVYPPHSDLPVMTTIGSPNFGYRSMVRDLEAQLFLVTSNPSLRQSLHQVMLIKRSVRLKVAKVLSSMLTRLNPWII